MFVGELYLNPPHPIKTSEINLLFESQLPLWGGGKRNCTNAFYVFHLLTKNIDSQLKLKFQI